MAPPLAAVALQNAVLFGVYGNVLNLLSSKQDEKPSLSHISVAAAASGAAQLWVVCPMELVKIKLQMQTQCKCICIVYFCTVYRKNLFLYTEQFIQLIKLFIPLLLM